MLNDITYQRHEKEIIDVERAITELRRGGLILLTDNSEASLVMAMETTTERDYLRFQHLHHSYHLVITANRAKHSMNSAPSNIHVSIDASHKKLEELQQLSGLIPQEKAHSTRIYDTTTPATLIDNAAITLSKAAELLPATLVITLPDENLSLQDWARRNGIVTLSVTALNRYQTNIATTLTNVCEASLRLAHAEQARMIAFRPVTGDKEHYAIIIGNPTEAPLVRIHSSCYTGDLLGSLRCDCGDQLQAAISLMGADKQGGIILYLMQEGRGIGLTNKLRTYALQETGIDTVDANEILGFEDDERLFQPAAEMLRKLGYNTVQLLTNNFRKAKGLESYGITVSQCVPHVMKAHRYNEHYLKTKANRLRGIIYLSKGRDKPRAIKPENDFIKTNHAPFHHSHTGSRTVSRTIPCYC